MRFILPLVIFLVLAGFLYVGLSLDPREVPSPLVGKPAPAFTLPQLHDAKKQFSPQEMKGKVWLLNVWASWCPACKIEHPVLNDMSRRGIAPIVGLNYKDQRADAKRWLQQNGDPYQLSVWDFEGKVGIDYGVYGAPETFVIDKQGVIRYKHIGPVTPKVLNDTIAPLVRRLQS